MNGIAKTKPELETILQDFRRHYTDPKTNGFALMLCDNDENVVQTFLESGDGLNIGAFAEVAGASVDTVRHWVECELVTTFSLNGKFKFMPPNLLELRSVQQWQGLGLTLEQIKERKAAGMTYIPTQSLKIGDEVLENGVVQMFRHDDPRVKDLPVPENGELFAKNPTSPTAKNTIASVKAEFDAQIGKLEEQHQEIEQKLANARALRARLEINL